MPTVKIKYVVSFTSQDENYKAVNLVNSDGFKKWLTNPKDRTTEASVTLQLEKECKISYIDIGTHWCANIEIQVGRSDWPQGREFEMLSPTCIMMTPMDCNLNRNFACTRMFSNKDFNDHVAAKTWDRIRIICRQPLKKDAQYGLSFLRIKTTDEITPRKDSTSLTSSEGHKSVKSIQKHFFGKTKSSDAQPNLMKTKLLKMAGSTENGTESENGMSRTAKLVLAASTGSRPREATPSKSSLYSDTIAQKYGPEFKEEVETFIGSLEIKEDELDKVTIADLRHKLERKKKRKLDKEERKTFAEMARNYICALFGDSEEEKKKENSGETIKNSKERETTQIKAKNSGEITKGSIERERTLIKTKNSIIKQSADCSNPVICPSSKIDDVGQSKEDENSSITLTEQLKQVRETANQLYKEKLEKLQSAKSSAFTNGDVSDEKGAQNTQFTKTKNNEDDMYKSMTFLERKAFALTNPYKLNRYGNSLSFGPGMLKSNDDENDTENRTNDTWLSKVNTSRNDVMITPPTSRKRKRNQSEKGMGRAKKGPRSENGPKTPGRGRGKNSAPSKEVQPTSFERCPHCKGTFPPWQISDHKIICSRPVSPDVVEVKSPNETINSCHSSPDVIEIGSSGPSVVNSLRAPEYIECPLCSGFYSSDVIQFHASVCEG